MVVTCTSNLGGAGLLAAQESDASTGRADRPPPVSIVCQVEGKTTILKLVPNAARVKKGDVLCELDSAPLRERLDDQELMTEEAKQALTAAEEDVKVAKARQAALVQDTLAAEETELNKQVTVARGYEAQVKRKLKKLSDGLPPEEYPVRNATQELTEATVWRKQTEAALAAFSVKKTGKIRVYVIAIEQALTTEKARLETYKLELTKRDKLKAQVEKCTIKAPCAGMIAIASPTRAGSGLVREGESIHERQVLMRILPDAVADPPR
jgi:multidrug resistance efflux pump